MHRLGLGKMGSILIAAACLLFTACSGGSNQLASLEKETAKAHGKKDPIAVASGFPLKGQAPKIVQFKDGGSYDPDGGNIIKWEWKFDDSCGHANGNGWQNFTSTQGRTSHTFLLPGDYDVTLRVTDDDGK